jgi:Sulfotransferase domain
MALRVVGAGNGRTGTHSLKVAFERLLGAPCYHMRELFEHHPEHIPAWHAAARGQMPEWDDLFAGYAAAVDWPAAAFWPELMEAYPDALVLLSVRDSESWWQSASNTIFPSSREYASRDEAGREWFEMVMAMMTSRFTPDLENREAAIAAYEAHNQKARDTVPPSRFLEWTPSDGWDPICAALGLPVPDEPFPLTNTREEWTARLAARREESATQT